MEVGQMGDSDTQSLQTGAKMHVVWTVGSCACALTAVHDSLDRLHR